jgi:hypothetical protein
MVEVRGIGKEAVVGLRQRRPHPTPLRLPGFNNVKD